MRALLLLLVPSLAFADGAPSPSPPPRTLAAATARCAKDDAKACVRAGQLYEDAFFSRDSSAADQDRSIAAFHKACALDDFDGCLGVAWWHAENREYATAVAMLEPLCSRTKDVSACAMLASHLERGEQGVPADTPRALKLFEQSCAAARGGEGCLSGCNDLAFWFEYGRNAVKEDHAASLRNYDRACELGCMNSCDTAGDMHRDGFAGEREPQRSVPLYQKACEGGFAPSCEALSDLYAAGTGVAKNAAKAKQLHVRACRLSDNQVSTCPRD